MQSEPGRRRARRPPRGRSLRAPGWVLVATWLCWLGLVASSLGHAALTDFDDPYVFFDPDPPAARDLTFKPVRAEVLDDDEIVLPPKLSGKSGEPDLIVHLVPHSHVAHGWIHTVDDVEATVDEILNQMTTQLDLDASRRFVWAEVWYLRRWFERQPARVQDRTRRLVREGKLELVSGALVQTDEALASSQGVMDQLDEGRAWLLATFGQAPRIAWAVDAFGHSDSTPELYQRYGYSALVINRIHHRLKQRFRQGQHLEFVWQAGKPWSNDAVKTPVERTNVPDGLFTHVLHGHYASPDGYDFERAGVRDVTAPRGRASRLILHAKDLARSFRTHHVLVPWGDDFSFQNAAKQFDNMDKIIKDVNERETGVSIRYSTLSEYFNAVHSTAAQSSLRFPLWNRDFFPFADGPDGYWTGFYSTRPALKRAARVLESRVRWASNLYVLARARAGQAGNVPRVGAISSDGRVEADKSAPTSWGGGLHRTLVFARRQSTLVATSLHAITGTCKEPVARDFAKRAKVGLDKATAVGAEALSHLAAKRKSAFTATGPHVRPWLKPLDQPIALREGDSRQWPVLVTNEEAYARLELVKVRLDCAWSTARRVRAVDFHGKALPSQVHHVIVPAPKSEWRTEIFLHVLVEVPALGFATIFVSSASNLERMDAAAASAASGEKLSAAAVQLQVYDLVDGAVARGGGAAREGDASSESGVRRVRDPPKPEEGGGCFALSNDRLAVEMDCLTGLARAVLDIKTRRRTLLREQIRLHESPRSGAHLFRPNRLESTARSPGGRVTIAMVRGPLVQEVTVLSDGVVHTTRLLRAPASFSAGDLQGFVHVQLDVAPSSHADTMLRFATDMKTHGFFTDNAAGSLIERKPQPDAPLAAAYFPCASSIVLRDFEPTPTHRLGQVLTIAMSQPMGCTGAASLSAGAQDYGTVELMVHRSHANDDGRGLGEGADDVSVARVDLLLSVDPPEAGLAKRPHLVHRAQRGDAVLLTSDASLSALLSREAWLSRFMGSASYARDAQGHQLKLSLTPGDEVGDDAACRVEWHEPVSVDWAHVFAPDVIVAGVRPPWSDDVQRLSFLTSGVLDDFHAAFVAGASADAVAGGSNPDAPPLSDYLTNPDRELVARVGVEAKAARPLGKPHAIGGKDATGLVLNGASAAAWEGGRRVEFKRGVASAVITLAFKEDDAAAVARPPSSMYEHRPAGQPAHVAVAAPVVAAAASAPPRTSLRSTPPPSTTPPPVTQQQQQHASPPPWPHKAAAAAGAHGHMDAEAIRKALRDEEAHANLLDKRVDRLESARADLIREVELAAPDSEDKKRATEEFARAEELLIETRRAFADSEAKIIMLNHDLDRLEALDELRAKHGNTRGSRRGGGDNGTVYGALVGATAMLIAVVSLQWFMNARHRRGQHHQPAFVPVRYVHNHPPVGFAMIGKRL